MKLKDLIEVLDEIEWVTIILDNYTLYNGILENMTIEHLYYNDSSLIIKLTSNN